MTEEEYKKALAYVEEELENDLNSTSGTTMTPGEYVDNVQRKVSGAGASSALQAIGASIANAIVGATKSQIEHNRREERNKFFDKFTSDAFTKAQAKYEPKKDTTTVSRAQQSPTVLLDTAAYTVSEKDLAQV